MLFTIQQIQEITGIIDFHSSFLIFQVLGKDSLSEFDKYNLEQAGINIGELVEKFPPYWQGYMFGRLTGQLSNYQSGKIEYTDFVNYLKRGQYVPLTKREKEEYKIAKQKTYGHIKGLGNNIKTNVNDIITEESTKRRQEYEKVIKDEIKRGVVERKSIQSVISEIGHKTSDWNRDWGRIVDTEMQSIFNKGRSEQIRKDKGDDALVYKETYPGACRHCIRLHLTNGIGSKPRLFTIPQLEANGDNIGKKVNDWKPTIYVVHPFCRCHLTYLPKGYEWDEEKKSFDVPKEYKQKVERVSKVEMKVGDKTFYI